MTVITTPEGRQADVGTPELCKRHTLRINRGRGKVETQRPMDTYLALGYVEQYQFDATERLYMAFMASGLGDSPTMDWDRYTGASRPTGGDETDHAGEARKQWRDALNAIKDYDSRMLVATIVCHAGNDDGALFAMTTQHVQRSFLDALDELARHYGYTS